MSGLSRDGWLLFVTCAVRSFAYGFLSVMLGLFLSIEQAMLPQTTGSERRTHIFATLFSIDAFAGGLKIIYDIAIFALFRHVRPPEEVGRWTKE